MDHILRSLLQSDTNAHHLDSFDNLVAVHIPAIVQLYGHFSTLAKTIAYSFEITEVVSSPTRPSPSNCHEFGLNHLFCVSGLITLRKQGQVISAQRLPLVYIPLMTGQGILSSDRDPDPEPFSGLFISKGKCRTIPPSKTLVYNRPLLQVKNGVHTLQVRSAHREKIYRSTSTLDMSVTDMGVIHCRVPFQTTPIQLRVLVLALGGTVEGFLHSLRKTANVDPAVFGPLAVSLEYDQPDVQTQHEAVMYLSHLFGKALLSTGQNILKNEVFPHVGVEFTTKLQYLCMCTVQLVLFHQGYVSETPRDNYALSQITTSAGHLGSMFRLLFIAHIRTCVKLFRRMANREDGTLDISKVYGEHRLSSRVMSAVSSGMWSTIRKGVSINLNSNNFDAIESQLRRISSSLATTSGNHVLPRNVMSDQYGFVCAASSPDGEATGLIYELGVTATISPPVNDVGGFHRTIQLWMSHLFQPIAEWIESTPSLPSYLYVDASGVWAGCTTSPNEFIEAFWRLRRTGTISPFAFIEKCESTRTIQITYQEGILCRPLLLCGQEHRITGAETLDRMLATGILEYVSPAEQTTLCRIALSLDRVTPLSTHVELTQASFLGKLASSVVFATGQQGPRLAYSTLQRKQIVTGGTKRFRGANETNQLWNSHRPLLRTRTSEYLPESVGMCRGVPVVLAIMALPQNQEDAIVLKRSTIERGAFMMSDHREYISEAPAPCPTRSEHFERPDGIISQKTVSYDYVGDDGLPRVGTFVPGGSVIIGKTQTVKRTSICKDDVLAASARKCDISTCTRKDENGVVTVVERSVLPNGTRVRVVVSTSRLPEVGDKFTSQYAQKGVVGAIWEDVDMPFSLQTGMSPDLIVSPLSMTSRMTMSSLLEALGGKAVAVSGDYSAGVDEQDYAGGHDGSSRKFEAMLRKQGFASNGTERFIDGRTGTVIKARLFVGVVDYYRLVHIASKKIHARSTGPRDPLTRQPRDGRRLGGGLRVGEMESSALAAHGSSRVLQERFRELSDSFEIFVCTTCHLMCDDVCREVGYEFCRRCQSDTTVRSVLVPFTFLILTLELLSTGVVTKFLVDQGIGDQGIGDQGIGDQGIGDQGIGD